LRSLIIATKIIKYRDEYQPIKIYKLDYFIFQLRRTVLYLVALPKFLYEI